MRKRPCCACGRLADCKTCAGCMAAHYCGELCQKAHWKAHRSVCSRTVKTKGAPPRGAQKDLAACLNALMSDNAFVEDVFAATLPADGRRPVATFAAGRFVAVAVDVHAFLALDARARREMLREANFRSFCASEEHVRFGELRFSDPAAQQFMCTITPLRTMHKREQKSPFLRT